VQPVVLSCTQFALSRNPSAAFDAGKGYYHRHQFPGALHFTAATDKPVSSCGSDTLDQSRESLLGGDDGGVFTLRQLVGGRPCPEGLEHFLKLRGEDK